MLASQPLHFGLAGQLFLLLPLPLPARPVCLLSFFPLLPSVQLDLCWNLYVPVKTTPQDPKDHGLQRLENIPSWDCFVMDKSAGMSWGAAGGASSCHCTCRELALHYWAVCVYVCVCVHARAHTCLPVCACVVYTVGKVKTSQSTPGNKELQSSWRRFKLPIWVLYYPLLIGQLTLHSPQFAALTVKSRATCLCTSWVFGVITPDRLELKYCCAKSIFISRGMTSKNKPYPHLLLTFVKFGCC